MQTRPKLCGGGAGCKVQHIPVLIIRTSMCFSAVNACCAVRISSRCKVVAFCATIKNTDSISMTSQYHMLTGFFLCCAMLCRGAVLCRAVLC
jgi:hypothetical protein